VAQRPQGFTSPITASPGSLRDPIETTVHGRLHRVWVMAENPKATDKPIDGPSCNRCGGVLKPAAMLAKSFDHPAYKIFECEACGCFDWVTQWTTSKNPPSPAHGSPRSPAELSPHPARVEIRHRLLTAGRKASTVTGVVPGACRNSPKPAAIRRCRVRP